MNETPQWLVELLAAGELREAKARELRARAGVQEQLAQLAQSDAALLAEHPVEEVARELHRRLELSTARGRVTRSRERVWWSAAAAAACALMLFVWVREPAAPSGGPSAREQIRERGLQPHLIVFRKTTRGVERLADRTPVRAGDMLQLAYVSAGRKYGVVASIDSRGTITLHLPEKAATAVRLQEQGQSALPHAYELDATPGSERFVFVSADQPFPTDVVVHALRTNSALDSQFVLSEITLEKQP